MSGTDERLRREIEILRARGLDASAIIDLGYTPTRVANTFTAQDALLEEDDRPAPRALRPIDNHGTRNGYQRHRNRGEQPCEPCRRAAAEHMNRCLGAA